MTAQHWLWVSLTGNLVLLVGWFLTLGWGETYRQACLRLQRRVAILTDPDPTCGCGHHFSFHNEAEGCHFTVVHYKDAWNGKRGVLSNCACVQYTGPEPLPRVISIERPPREEGDDPA
jgi:hypothetical protein